jgi:hypothetical protein
MQQVRVLLFVLESKTTTTTLSRERTSTSTASWWKIPTFFHFSNHVVIRVTISFDKKIDILKIRDLYGILLIQVIFAEAIHP